MPAVVLAVQIAGPFPDPELAIAANHGWLSFPSPRTVTALLHSHSGHSLVSPSFVILFLLMASLARPVLSLLYVVSLSPHRREGERERAATATVHMAVQVALPLAREDAEDADERGGAAS